ncbi:MAG: hypothetical protein HLUCCX14_07755 [Marinobacter excellens HL-55]|uniref:Uncharacterized protein n=1 Tax=Marinobacter excellens HL-55 TaxID=1305731 RepID=A0A0P7YFA3_9GAMM|nr:MAG: hypothetical protein HLUCCX14_07755 [Marinobacter excellens HL-55]
MDGEVKTVLPTLIGIKNINRPGQGACIQNNELTSDSLAYMNFHGIRGLELLFAAMDPDLSLLFWQSLSDILSGPTEFFADSDMSIHDCQARFGRTLPAYPE